MAPKTGSTDSHHVTPHDSPDPSSQERSLVPPHDALAFVHEQMALIIARLDAQTANAAAAAATPVADPLVAQRRHDAHHDPPRHEQSEDLPPPLPYPAAGYAHPTHGPLFPEAPPYRAPISRGHPHRTARRLRYPPALPFPVDRLLPSLADFPLPPSVVLTPAVAAVAPPLTRWSSPAPHMKPHALIRTRSTGP
jgi:hypothetical protein